MDIRYGIENVFESIGFDRRSFARGFGVYFADLRRPRLIAASLVIYSDTRESVQARVAWSIVPAVGMVVVMVLAGIDGSLWQIPGAALLMATAVWSMLRRPVDASTTTDQ